MPMPKVTIYTDGSADPNPGIGGWAAILRSGPHEKLLSGNDPEATNNAMELTAAISALQTLKTPCQVELYTDSEYLRQGVTRYLAQWQAQGWQRSGEPIPNAELWRALSQLTQTHQIEWHWIKGHADNEFNNRCDQVAREARLKITPAWDANATKTLPTAYLRASCLGNPGRGGWAVILEHEGSRQIISGHQEKTTNNRMELEAALAAFSLLPPQSPLQLYTMSNYLYQGATQWVHNWRRQRWLKHDGLPVVNSAEWKRLDAYQKDHPTQWINAKGQSIEQLTLAGELAKKAVQG